MIVSFKYWKRHEKANNSSYHPDPRFLNIKYQRFTSKLPFVDSRHHLPSDLWETCFHCPFPRAQSGTIFPHGPGSPTTPAMKEGSISYAVEVSPHWSKGSLGRWTNWGGAKPETADFPSLHRKMFWKSTEFDWVWWIIQLTRFYLASFTKFHRSLCCKLELFGEGEGRLFFPTSHIVLLLEAFLGGGIAVNSKHNLQHHSMDIRVFPRKAYT